MKALRMVLPVVAGIVSAIVPGIAQDLEYRLSVVDESSINTINRTTPINYDNNTIPQPDRGNVGSLNLFLSAEGFSTLLNLTTRTDNLHSPSYDYHLRECAFDLPLTDNIDVTVGKKILKWGTGYAFNPTGVVEPQHSPSDPSDRLGQNEGNTLVALDMFVGKNSLTFVYANDVRIESMKLHWGTPDVAVRACIFLSGLDLSLIGHYRRGDRLELGFNWSYVVGSNLELHGEFLGKEGSSNLYHESIAADNGRQIFGAAPYTALYDQSHRIFSKFLVGGQYTFDNGLNIAVEYYRNTEGLTRHEWNKWMMFVTFQSAVQRGQIAMPPALREASRVNLLQALQTLSTRGATRDYLFVRENWTVDRWRFEFIQFLNIQDVSSVMIPTVSFKLNEHFSTYGRLSLFSGDSGSEFGVLFYSSIVNIGIQFVL